MTTLVLLTVLVADSIDDANLYLYPSTTRVVMIVNMAAIRSSGLFNSEIREGFDRILAEDEQTRKVSEVLKLDPSKNIDHFTVCGNGAQAGPPPPPGEVPRDDDNLFIINGKLPYEEITKNLEKMAESGELTPITINDLPVYFNHRARNAFYFAVIDGNTVISAIKKRTMEDAVEGLTKLRKPKPDLLERLKWDVDEEKSPVLMRMAGVFPESARQQMAEVPQLAGIAKKMIGYNLTMRVEEKVIFKARLTMTDSTSSKQASNAFTAMINLGKAFLSGSERRPDIVEMLEATKIASKDENLLFDVEFSRDLMRKMMANNKVDEERMRRQMAQRKAARKKSGEESKSSPSKENASTSKGSNDKESAPTKESSVSP